MPNRLALNFKKFLYPGLDVHTRDRYQKLSRYFREGDIRTLDAGCGNGALSYAAYLKGNRILGVSFDPVTNARTREFFTFLSLDPSRIEIRDMNLYDLNKLKPGFDQIICSETLEHLSKDGLIVDKFHHLLKPGGVLHLCCPYALHPDNQLGLIDGPEDGGHVRDGYTLDSYKALLEPRGFKIARSRGLGSNYRQFLDGLLRPITSHLGPIVAIPFFLIILPLLWFDREQCETPFSLYVECIKI